MNQGIDTTACMQEILEAYRVLSNPESRHEYDKELGGGQIRVFRTFTVGPEDDEQAAPFVVYWNAACRLQENRRPLRWKFFGEQLPRRKNVRFCSSAGKMLLLRQKNKNI